MLVELQRDTFTYFEQNANLENGLIADQDASRGRPRASPRDGLWAQLVRRRGRARPDDAETALARTLAVVRFLYRSEQSDARDATGYHGLYYHFLDMVTGRRAGQCELSTIDTALLLAGVLTAAQYFRGEGADENELRTLADALYRRADWTWLSNTSGTIGHGWTPEGGRLPSSWDDGYSEALILYVLALGSPTFPISVSGYDAWTSTFEQKTAYGTTYVYAGPLFVHQFSQLWLDLRGVNDDCNRRVGYDYFENSRRATLVHRAYAVDNPRRFAHYSKNAWGLTASDGPGPGVRVIDGVRREFYGYLARGAPFGPDDGTLSPWAVVASLPFAPEIVRDAIHHAVGRLGLRDPARRTGVRCQLQPGHSRRQVATLTGGCRRGSSG